MDNYSGPKDIYEELVENAPRDEEWLLGLVAFAVVEEQKIEWMKHQVENSGGLPSTQDIDHWYQQQPSGILLRAKDTAEARLKDFANNSITTYMADFQKETENGIIVGEIREIKKFWPQFGISLAGGFVSSLLLAAFLVLLAFLVYHDKSPVEIGEKLSHQSVQKTQPEKTEAQD